MNARLAVGALLLVGALGSVARAQPEGAPGGPPQGPADIMRQAAEGRARSDLLRAARAGDRAAENAQASNADASVPVPHGARANEVVTAAGARSVQAGDLPTAPAGHGAASPAANTQGDAGAAAISDAGAAMGDAADAAVGAAGAHAHGDRDPHTVLAEPEQPTAQPKLGSPSGSIEVTVIAADGAPKANAEIVLGVMANMGGRTEQRATTDAQGHHVFRGLAIGTQQAYRVNVIQDGAKFSSTPFRLPEDSGYEVRVPLRATTLDSSLLFQVIGQTVVELRDERLHITQQARLANAGERVIVFPKDGLLVPLPEGFTAFQWQDQMTDQRGEELKDKGFRIRGSLPPGSVTLAWTFDLPRSGASAKIAVEQPWRTYTYRVISEAPEGLKLRVSEFPEPERVQDQQRDLFFTQLQRRPSDPQLGRFTIKLDGIPGPGPGRWIAVVLALAAAGFGLLRARKPADDLDERKAVLATRKAELLALAQATESEHARGETGPQFHAERLHEITTELALVLRDESALAPKK